MQTKAFWKSKGLIGAFLVIGAWLANATGAMPDAETSGALVGALDEGATLVGGVLALWGRLAATTKLIL